METFYIYCLKSTGIISAFYLFYILLLQKETFFNANRWFLLSGIVASVVLPIITISKIVWVEPEIQTAYQPMVNLKSIPSEIVQVAKPVFIDDTTFEINWFWVIMVFYGVGVFIFLTKFLLELNAINKIIRRNKVSRSRNLNFVATTDLIAPFSFFKSIVINPNQHSESDFQNILEHEKVHCSQYHSVDVLFARLFSIVFWFNPIVWLYKKAIVQNLEFIADSGAIRNISNRKNYQLTLLKITTHQDCVPLSNPFYQSLIKKRIVMLNKNQSKSWNALKYAIVIPMLVFFMLQFQVKVIAQEKEPVNLNTALSIVKVSKNETAEELKAASKRVKDAHNIDLKFYKIKRNKAGEIQSISASFDDNNGSKSEYKQTKSSVIDDFIFVYEKKPNGKMQIGFQDLTDAKRSPLIKDILEHGSGMVAADSIKIIKKGFSLNPNTIDYFKGSTNPIYVINDTIRSANDFRKISANDIDAVTVLSQTDAEAKYGINGKNGAIVIKTKVIDLKVNSKQIGLVIINDTISSLEKLNDIHPENIDSFTMLKSAAAIKKYGEKGKNGVYEVKTNNNKTVGIVKTMLVPDENGVPTKTKFVFTKFTKKLVVIDAGHGGIDYGAVHGGVSEKRIVESIANKIKSLGENSQIEIVLIRSDDNFMSLEERAAKINELKPSLLISLHVNSNTNTSKNGIEAFVYNQSEFYDESTVKANDLLDKIASQNLKNNGVQDARFMILRKTNCPAFLLELGYLTNESNRKYLSGDNGQNEIANKIFQFLKKK